MKSNFKKWQDFFQKRLGDVKDRSRERILTAFDTFEPGYIHKDGKRLLNLCSNDYLGLAKDFHSLEECKILAEIIPPGAGASRLITGGLIIHHELEKLLASWKGTESALVFPSGYQTNIGVLTTLAGKGDAIFSDKLNHASIIDGSLMSGASLYRYQHNDLDDLETQLKAKRPRKRLIVTDSVFSMDGDLAPLAAINKLAKKYGALLVIDDAHATGVLGESGAGSCSHLQIPCEEHIVVIGTLSKAIGCQGGFVCASKTVIKLLINTCRSFIFSTALSPLLAGMSHFNISRILEEEHRIQALHDKVRFVRQALRDAGFPIPDDPTPIIPIVIGENDKTNACSKKLRDQGIIAVGIRPPTVPEGTARLRLSICAAHEQRDLENAVAIIAETLNETIQETE